jgi:hypothetical protein
MGQKLNWEHPAIGDVAIQPPMHPTRTLDGSVCAGHVAGGVHTQFHHDSLLSICPMLLLLT